MGISLYDATVPSWIQIMESVRSLTEMAEAFCTEKGISQQALINKRFGDDMLPLSWQFKWTVTHSIKAIEAVREGVQYADMEPAPETFAEIREQIDQAIAKLKEVKPEEMEGFVGKDMLFSVPEHGFELHFTAENYLMSFSLPNFYFHATTAYDLLRDAGLQIGKQNFMGRVRSKEPPTAQA